MRKWRSVLFSDESTFIQFQQGHQEKVWHEPGEILNPDCSVTSKTHAKIIQDYVIPTLDKYFPCGNGIFQEDNTLPYHSKVAMATHKDAKIVVLQWPAQSLDLNPI
ncbi:unnamed protein product [Rhizophagus irregularis]|nr:unnamed protein product [Rhizophagus irregularis]